MTNGQAAPGKSPGLATYAGVVVLVLLCAACLGLSFTYGAYSPAEWLPFSIGLAALAIVACISGPAPAALGRFRLVLIGLFAAQAVWTAASALWASSLSNAWEEANRTLFYAVGLT